MTANDVFWLFVGWMLACGTRLVLDLITNELDRRKKRRRAAARAAQPTTDQ